MVAIRFTVIVTEGPGPSVAGTEVWSVLGDVRYGPYFEASGAGFACGGVIAGARSSPTRSPVACVHIIISIKGGRAAVMGLVQDAKWRAHRRRVGQLRGEDFSPVRGHSTH